MKLNWNDDELQLPGRAAAELELVPFDFADRTATFTGYAILKGPSRVRGGSVRKCLADGRELHHASDPLDGLQACAMRRAVPRITETTQRLRRQPEAA